MIEKIKIEIENMIQNIKAEYNTEITEIESKIPDVNILATKTALTTAENKILNISNLVKKTDYDTKITEIEKKIVLKKRICHDHDHDKYITTTEFNTLAASGFNARLAQAILVTKTDFGSSASSLDSTIAANKTKKESIENELKKLKSFDSNYFKAKVTLKKMEHKII